MIIGDVKDMKQMLNCPVHPAQRQYIRVVKSKGSAVMLPRLSNSIIYFLTLWLLAYHLNSQYLIFLISKMRVIIILPH